MMKMNYDKTILLKINTLTIVQVPTAPHKCKRIHYGYFVVIILAGTDYICFYMKNNNIITVADNEYKNIKCINQTAVY